MQIHTTNNPVINDIVPIVENNVSKLLCANRPTLIPIIINPMSKINPVDTVHVELLPKIYTLFHGKHL